MSILPAKYCTQRKFPSDNGNNWTTIQIKSDKKIDTLEQFIGYELDVTRRMLKTMGCNEKLIKNTLEELEKTFKSADFNFSEDSEEGDAYTDVCIKCDERLKDIDINSCDICCKHLCDDCIQPHDVFSGLCDGCFLSDKEEKQRCELCYEKISSLDIDECGGCEENVKLCNKCVKDYRCVTCKQKLHEGCVYKCSKCEGTLCRDREDKCYIDDIDSDVCICMKCLENCVICEKKILKSTPLSCVTCKQKLHEDCAYECSKCEGTLCDREDKCYVDDDNDGDIHFCLKCSK